MHCFHMFLQILFKQKPKCAITAIQIVRFQMLPVVFFIGAEADEVLRAERAGESPSFVLGDVVLEDDFF